jgi:hypothetical protein
MYDDNNNVFRSVYQALVTTIQGLEWTFNIGKLNIIGESLPKSSQNIVLMLGISSSIANVIANDFQVNNELINVAPYQKIAFIDLRNFSDEDEMFPIFVHLFDSSLLILTLRSISSIHK